MTQATPVVASLGPSGLPAGSSTTLLRIATAGSVDDGKSTLIGRLLYDSKAVMEDQLAVGRDAPLRERGPRLHRPRAGDRRLRAEREQGITIDVAYRYFATPKRKFIIADTPGTHPVHAQHGDRYVDGAAGDRARRRPPRTAGAVPPPRFPGFAPGRAAHRAGRQQDGPGRLGQSERFDEIRDEFHAFAARLDVHDVTTIPMSALLGDNVVTKSEKTPWYEGPALLAHLEDVYIAGDRNLVDVRFPVQYVIRPQTHDHADHRSYAGTVASGVMRPGDEVVVLPSGKTSRHHRDRRSRADLSTEAFPPMAVSISLADDIDISRGDLLARVNNQPDADAGVRRHGVLDGRRGGAGAGARLHHQAHHPHHAGQGHGARLPTRRQHPAPRQVRQRR